MIYEVDREAVGYMYEKVAHHVARRIASGELLPNKPLPAERRLAEEYGVSLGTGRRATELLREWGLAVTLRSKGTFVVERPGVGTESEVAEDEPEAGWLEWVREFGT